MCSPEPGSLRCAAALLCIWLPGQAIIHLLAQVRDNTTNLAEPACDGVPASRQLADTYRAQQREIVQTASGIAANLRAREQGALFRRYAVLSDLQKEVSTTNAADLCRLARILTEVLGLLSDLQPAKLPSCVAEAVAAGGAERESPSKRGQESLGALGHIAKKACYNRPPTPHHSANAACAAGGGAPKKERSIPQPDGPPEREPSEGASADEEDEDVADYLDRCLSPESDFSLSPR